MSAQQPAQAPFAINAQYVKDLSFENPNALKSLSAQNKQQPDLNVNVDVSARGVTQNSYEVSLKITAEAVQNSEKIFIVDLDYAGVFSLNSVPQEQIAPLLLIEGPRFLFPFARNIIANATREGGFPPLALAPIDFLSLYQAQQKKGNGIKGVSAPSASKSSSKPSKVKPSSKKATKGKAKKK